MIPDLNLVLIPDPALILDRNPDQIRDQNLDRIQDRSLALIRDPIPGQITPMAFLGTPTVFRAMQTAFLDTSTSGPVRM